MQQLNNKRIVLGITGGIAAYKSADLVRHLKKEGASVRCIMTKAAEAFITPMTLQALSGHPVHTDLLDATAEAAMSHIALARWADFIVIAPASADSMARLIHGHANDLLTTCCLASDAPVAIVPAMNQRMWKAASTQHNIELLKKNHYLLWGPDEGVQACGDVGPGRMLEPFEITSRLITHYQTGVLQGKKVLVTAGPTQEPIDAVRFISNPSSGKMGYALCEAAIEAGATVMLISGPVSLPCPDHVARISVGTGREMHDAVMSQQASHDIVIGCAAVTDFFVETLSAEKIKKDQLPESLKLTENPDIIKSVAALETKPFTVGFAAETEHVLQNAKEKLTQKKLDLIIANNVKNSEGGFGSDNNEATALWSLGEKQFGQLSKRQLARELIALIGELLCQKP